MISNRGRLLSPGVFILMFVCILASAAIKDTKATDQTTSISPKQALEHVLQVPIQFEPNWGQAPEGVRFLSQGPAHKFYIRDAGAELVLPGKDKRTSTTVRLTWEGSQTPSQVEGVTLLEGKSNYYYGNDTSRWISGVPQFRKVVAHQIYPGVDLVFYGQNGKLEYDFVLAPGADPKRIQLSFDGADDIKLASNGDLHIKAGDGTLVQHKPVVYQEKNGARQSVKAKYVLRNDQRVTLALARYDRSRELIVDPILNYGAYVSFLDLGNVKGTRDVYRTVTIAGTAFGNSGALVASPAQAVNQGNSDVYVLKLRGDGNAILFATYFGGNNAETFGDITFESKMWNVIVVGRTWSANFPTLRTFTSPAYPGFRGTSDAFVFQLNQFGALVFSSLLGGSNDDGAVGVAADRDGNFYVGGSTNSSNLPGTSSAASGWDSFVTKFSPDGSTILYSTLFGGSGDDFATGLDAHEVTGAAYITGNTNSPSLPTVNPRQGTPSGGLDGFVARLSSSGAVDFATYLGGNLDDLPTAISVSWTRQFYVVGSTRSTTFPTFGTASSLLGAQDAFITSYADSTAYAFSRYVGGSKVESLVDVDSDGSGNAFAIGKTNSSDISMLNAIQAFKKGASGPLFRSSGNGTWTASSNGLNIVDQAIAIVTDPTNASNKYLMNGQCHFFRSTDTGNTWTQGGDVCNARDIIHDPFTTSVLYAGLDSGISTNTGTVMKSVNGGVTWTLLSAGLPAGGVTGLAASPHSSSPLFLFASVRGQGLFRWSSATNIWQSVGGLGNVAIGGIAVDPVTVNRIYVSTATGVRPSNNNGDSFLPKVADAPPGEHLARFTFSGTMRYYAANCGLANSQDGINWVELQALPGLSTFTCSARSLEADAANPNTVWVGSLGGGIHKSTNRGATASWVEEPVLNDGVVTAIDSSSTGLLAGFTVPDDMFVVSYNPAGTTRYATYIGGTGADIATGIHQFADETLIFGTTKYSVTGSGFPVTDTPGLPQYVEGTVVGIIGPDQACTQQYRLISPESQVFSSDAQSGEVRVSANNNCSWSATTSDSWITITSGGPFSGSGNIQFNVATTTTSRTGSINIGGELVTIRQSAPACGPDAQISNNPITVSARGGQFVSNLTTGSTCPWNILPPISWIRATSNLGPTPVGSGTLTFTVEPNPGTQSRSYEVRLPPFRQGVVIMQQGRTAGENTSVPAFAYVRNNGSQVSLVRPGIGTFPTPPNSIGGSPAIAMAPNGDVYLAIRAIWPGLLVIRWNAQSRTWGSWVSAPGSFNGNPGIAVGPDGKVHIVARGFTVTGGPSDNYHLLYEADLTTNPPCLSPGAISSNACLTKMSGLYMNDPSIAVNGNNVAFIVGNDSPMPLPGYFPVVDFTTMYITTRSAAGVFQTAFLGGFTKGGTRPSIVTGRDNAAYIGIRDPWNSVWMTRVADINQPATWTWGQGVITDDLKLAASGGIIYLGAITRYGRTISTPYYHWYLEPTAPATIGTWVSWDSPMGFLDKFAVAGTPNDFFLVGYSNPPSDAHPGIGRGLYWWKLVGREWTYFGPADEFSTGPDVAAAGR